MSAVIKPALGATVETGVLAGTRVASLEVGEPELEEVFVKVMRAHAA